jgi:hypothetical protein
MSNNPIGPFKITGVFMDATPDCWTNQDSVIKYKDQWDFFYHHNDLSPHFDKNSSISIDCMFFNHEGTINKVTLTLRGLEIANPSSEIQVSRYSLKSNDGALIAFLETCNTFEGWKTIFDALSAWIRFNSVDFRSAVIKSINVRTLSNTDSTLTIRLDKADGPVIATVTIAKNNECSFIHSSLSGFEAGIHNLIVQLKDNRKVEIDWIKFD